MPRIKGITLEEATGEVRETMERQIASRGAVLNTTPIFALRPSILKGHQALAAGIAESNLLEPALKDLACLRAATINGCPF